MAVVSDRTSRVDASQDENADGVIDRRDDEIGSRRVSTIYASGSPEPVRTAPVDSDDEPMRFRTDPATTTAARASVLAPARTAPATPTLVTTPAISRDDSEVITPVGPRPRTSLSASLSLIVGVLAAVAAATGELAGLGIGLGVIAALLSFAGISATSRPHVTGKADALLGMLLGLAAIVFGVLMITSAVGWLSTDTNLLSNLHQWIQAHASWMLVR